MPSESLAAHYQKNSRGACDDCSNTGSTKRIEGIGQRLAPLTRHGVEVGALQWSILLRQHDRDDPLGDGRIGRIGRMHRQVLIEIIDLEHDHVTVSFE
jgi:hypothetical protein